MEGIASRAAIREAIRATRPIYAGAKFGGNSFGACSPRCALLWWVLLPPSSPSSRPNLPPAGPVLAGLDALWARYDKAWKRLLSPGVITELRLRASFDVDLMAPWRIANNVPKGTIPDCA